MKTPSVGALSIVDVPKETIEDFRDYLDTEVRARIAGGKGHGIRGKTAMILWTLVRGVFNEAVVAKNALGARAGHGLASPDASPPSPASVT